MKIRIGTRASKLAVIQAEIVASKLTSIVQGISIEIVKITTTGDRIIDKPLYDIGGKALFLKEIEQSLIEERIDIAVHSMKDVPGDVVHPELVFGAVLEREDPREVIVVHSKEDVFKSIESFQHGFLFGTSSMRRQAQLKNINSNLSFKHLRGNVPSRIEKIVVNQDANATLLARAGIDRLNSFDQNHMRTLEPEVIIPAVGQGIIGVQIRKNDYNLADLCAQINHKQTWQLLQIERGFLEYLHADCKTPLAAYARYEEQNIVADFFLADPNDHSKKVTKRLNNINIENGYLTGAEVAKSFLEDL